MARGGDHSKLPRCAAGTRTVPDDSGPPQVPPPAVHETGGDAGRAGVRADALSTRKADVSPRLAGNVGRDHQPEVSGLWSDACVTRRSGPQAAFPWLNARKARCGALRRVTHASLHNLRTKRQ